MKKNALLIIDPQNDFCNPGNSNGKGIGSLYVTDAENDMERLASWIRSYKDQIDFIGITIDSHQPNDISHPNFWMDKNGNFPAPFSSITSKEVDDICYAIAVHVDGQSGYAYPDILEAKIVKDADCIDRFSSSKIKQRLIWGKKDEKLDKQGKINKLNKSNYYWQLTKH